MMIQDAAEFFDGLTADKVNEKVAEYMSASRLPFFAWSVQAFGHNENGYWLMLVRLRSVT